MTPHESPQPRLKSIRYIEGAITVIPVVLMTALRKHIHNGGPENFCHDLWKDQHTLDLFSNRKARFLRFPGNGKPLDASRFTYGDSQQIIVVQYKVFEMGSTYSFILNPAGNHMPMNRITLEGWHNYPWQIWEDSSLPLTNPITAIVNDEKHQIVRAIRDKPSTTNIRSNDSYRPLNNYNLSQYADNRFVQGGSPRSISSRISTTTQKRRRSINEEIYATDIERLPVRKQQRISPLTASRRPSSMKEESSDWLLETNNSESGTWFNKNNLLRPSPISSEAVPTASATTLLPEPATKPVNYTKTPGLRNQVMCLKETFPTTSVSSILDALRHTESYEAAADHLRTQNEEQDHNTPMVEPPDSDRHSQAPSPDVDVQPATHKLSAAASEKVEFLFLDQDSVVKGTSKLADCTNAADLFDEAYMVDIVDNQTRMLHFNINDSGDMKVKVGREDLYQEKVMKPLENVIQDENIKKIHVCVSKGY